MGGLEFKRWGLRHRARLSFFHSLKNKKKKCIMLMLISFIGYNHPFKGIMKIIFQ